MVIGMNVADPVFRIRKPFLRGVAQNRFDLRADVEPLAMSAQFRGVADGCDLFDEGAVFDFSFGAGTLGAEALRDVVAHANRSTIGPRGDGHFRWDYPSVAVMHGPRPEPLALLFQRLAETCQSMIKGASANVALVTINSPRVLRRNRKPVSAAGPGCQCAAHIAKTRNGEVHSRSRNVPVGAGLTLCRYWASAAHTVRSSR